MIGGAISIQSPVLRGPLFAGGHQPARRSFGITQVTIGNEKFPVMTRDIAATPFCALVEFSLPEADPQGDLLVVAPLSGHFPVIARDLVVGLLPYFRVYVTDWINVRHVPAGHGLLDLEGNISTVLDAIKGLPPGLNVLGLCQGGVPALAATALLSPGNDAKTPASLILIASPIDPLANPSRVVQLIRSRPLTWFEQTMIATVPENYSGRGRRVYPAHLQLLALSAYLTRHVGKVSDTGRKVILDDGADPVRFPFFDLFSSIMDLDAVFFLENTRDVFQECLLRNGALYFKGERADPRAIRKTALLTIEGEADDTSAPGQASAAHDLVGPVPESFRRRLLVPGAGHFSLFYGDIWRKSVLPVIREFCGIQERPRPARATNPARTRLEPPPHAIS